MAAADKFSWRIQPPSTGAGITYPVREIPHSDYNIIVFSTKKKTVGIRIPNNNIVREIVKKFGNPIVSTSILDEDAVIEYSTDPELIYEKYKELVDLVIDGGYGMNIASTVVDCTDDNNYKIIREGKGNIDLIY